MLVMSESLFNFVEDVAMIYLNFIIIVVIASEKIRITFLLYLILFRHFLHCYEQRNDVCVVKNIPHKQS